MKEQLILCDTNILISAFEGDKKTTDILSKHITSENTILSVITFMELCRGALNKRQLNKIAKELKGYRILQINEKTSFLSSELIQKYHLSHGLQIPDAIIAASAITANIPLFTYNLKDFKFIPD